VDSFAMRRVENPTAEFRRQRPVSGGRIQAFYRRFTWIRGYRPDLGTTSMLSRIESPFSILSQRDSID